VIARLLRDAEHYLSALHGSVARHDNLAANLGCAGCELRDRIAAELRRLAVETQAAPPKLPPMDPVHILGVEADEQPPAEAVAVEGPVIVNRCDDCSGSYCPDCGQHYCCDPCPCMRSHNCPCECSEYDQQMTYAD